MKLMVLKAFSKPALPLIKKPATDIRMKYSSNFIHITLIHEVELIVLREGLHTLVKAKLAHRAYLDTDCTGSP